MADDLDRSFAFMARADMCGTRVEASPLGTVVTAPELPLRQDSNYLLVGRTGASAADVAAEVSSHGLRVVYVRDPETAGRLTPGLRGLGWKVHNGVVMRYTRPPTRSADTSIVTDAGEEALRPARRQRILAAPWGSPELAEQLLAAKQMIAARVETHFLAVLDGDDVVAYADLYLGEGTAQIEDLATDEAHRNRGYATALVLRGLELATDAGADFVFLVADADDWPRRLYGELGFDVIGGYRKFFP